MEEKKKVPKLRFPGFTDDWEQRKVSDICSISTGKSNTQDKVDDGAYPFYVRSPIVERSNKYLYDEEAVLTVGDGVGTGKVFHYVNGKYDLHQRVYRMFGFSNEVSAKYFYYWFSDHFYKRVMAMTAKTSVDSVRYEMIADMELQMPSKPEQEKIANFFTDLDKIITLHQREYDLLKEFKKGCLQKMFPRNGEAKPELRFPGFTDDWEQRKLSEVVTEIKRTDEKSDAPVMMITAENGFINQSERYSTNNAGQSLKKYILLEKGELAYNHGASKLRPYGSCFALTTEEKARIPFVYHCFSTETENSEFLSIVLNGKAVEKQLRRIVSSGARMDGLLNISFDEYTSIPVMLPRKDEQDRIAEYFKNLDHLITLHQRKLDELNQFKKGMLQKMFV